MTTTTLPLLRVQTKHSEYLIDQNAGTVTRTPVHKDANDFAGYLTEPTVYDEIASELEVGGQLVIIYPNDRWSASTPIVSVEEVQ